MARPVQLTPRRRLLRTRRGWMVGTLAALAAGGGAGLTAGGMASADGGASACPAVVSATTPADTTSTDTTTTDTTATDATSCAVAPPTDTTTTTDTTGGSDTTTTTGTTGTTGGSDTTTTTTDTTTTDKPPSSSGPGSSSASPSGDSTSGGGSVDQATADQLAAAGEPAGSPPPPPVDPGTDAKPVKTASAQATHDPATGGSTSDGAGHGSRTLRAHTHATRARKLRRRQGAAHQQVYFPPVSVDWKALTPLAPPPFPGAALQTFPGPLFLLPIYQAAATEYGVPWQVLAAINEVESNWGRNMGPSSAGAIGWMQFLPSTWRHFGVDANGDGIANPEDPVDAIFSAAHYLEAAGANSDLGRAIFAYNHGNWYVEEVAQRAIELGSIPEDLLTALTEQGRSDGAHSIRRAGGSTGLLDSRARITSVGRAMLLSDRLLDRHILGDRAISIYRCGRQDIAGGVVDRRVLEVLQYLVANGLRPTVSSLRCGHGFYTSSGNVSEHSSGDAVDISAINGIPILGHQGPGSITERTILELLKLGGGMKPHQIISLMTFQGADNTLSLPGHANHIHVGFAPRRGFAGLSSGLGG